MRGSRLGSAVLRRRVAAGLPASYLDAAPSLSWPRLLGRLDERERSGPDGERALIAGARATFAIYERLARRDGDGL